MLLDCLSHLAVAVLDKAVTAESRVMPADLYDCGFAAPTTFHRAPPETTGLSSISSSWSTRSSLVRSELPLITITESG